VNVSFNDIDDIGVFFVLDYYFVTSLTQVHS